MAKRALISPLGRRLIIWLFLTGLVISLASSAVILYVDYQNGLQRYANILENIKDSYTQSLTNSLWHFDHGQLTALTQGIANFPSISYVQIDNDKKVVIQQGDMYLPADKKIIIPLVYSSPERTELLGYLRINQSYQELSQNMYNRGIEILISQLLMALINFSILLLIVHYLINIRLFEMARWARSFSLDNLDQELPITEKYKDDELAVVPRAMNQMRLTIKEDLQSRENQQELNNRLKDQLELAVNNAEIGFCRYQISKHSMECNDHFARQFGLTELQTKSPLNLLNYMLDHLTGEQACKQSQQIKRLSLGQKVFLRDRYQFNIPGLLSVLDMSFQVVGYLDGQPETLLICSINRANEVSLQLKIEQQEQQHQQELAELEASHHHRLQILQDEKNKLAREFRLLSFGQQPKHIQSLTEMMASELKSCQHFLEPKRYQLWQQFLNQNFYKKQSLFDVGKVTSKKIKQMTEPLNIKLSKDLPMSLIIEENYEVFDFLLELLLSNDILSHTQSLHLKIRLIDHQISTDFVLTGDFERLDTDQLLALKMANAIVQMRYNGFLIHKKSGDKLSLLISAPFRT